MRYQIIGTVPLSALWAGALGGVVSSLQGMFYHYKHWNHGYDLWHVFSGTVGAAFGFVSYLFLQVTVVAAGGQSKNTALFVLAAFTLGYGQRQFHSIMDQAFSLVFHPPQTPKVTQGSVDISLSVQGAKGSLDVQQSVGSTKK